MEITLIERNGKQHNLTLPDIEPVSSDWLRDLCAKFFTRPQSKHGPTGIEGQSGPTGIEGQSGPSGKIL